MTGISDYSKRVLSRTFAGSLPGTAVATIEGVQVPGIFSVEHYEGRRVVNTFRCKLDDLPPAADHGSKVSIQGVDYWIEAFQNRRAGYTAILLRDQNP